MVKRFRQLVHETAGRTLSLTRDTRHQAACVPSIYFSLGSREPGNESHLHTPTFCASDDLIIPTAELSVRYILGLLNN